MFLPLRKGWVAVIGVLVTVVLRRISLRYNVMSPADVDLTPGGVEAMRHSAEKQASRIEK